MIKPKITLYFDLHSPFAFLAFHALQSDSRFAGCEIVYVPVLLIGIIKALKATPPWDTPNRVKWIENDLRRSAPYVGLTWKPEWPEKYPLTNTAKVQRALVACSLICPNEFVAIIAAFNHAFWVEKQAMQTPEVFLPIISQIAGEAVAERIATMSTSNEVKDRLTANTTEALDDGACGLPWMKVTTVDGRIESFWGCDHLGQIVDLLGNSKSTKNAHL